jgi:DNA polymerase-1
MNFPDLTLFHKFTVDTETTGVNWRHDKIFGVSISTPDSRDYYWDVRKTPKFFEWFNDQLKIFRGTVINHNLKFDIHMLREAGISMLDGQYKGFDWDCTMVRAALIDEHRFKYDLDSVAEDYIGLGKVDIYQELADMFGGKPTRTVQMPNLHKAPFELVAPYAKRDTRATLDLWHAQQKIIDDVNMHKVTALERDVMYVVQDMEHKGVRVDIPLAIRSMGELALIIKRDHAQLNSIAGFQVNPNPSGSIHKLFAPKQDKEGVWIAIDGTVLQSTGSGKACLDKNALMRMTHPAASKLLALRKWMKCKNTFLKSQIIDNAEKGMVYPNINQCKSDRGGTITGRLSVTEPALQIMPSRDEEIKKIIRPIFLPDEGQRWYRADYSQADVRCFTHYTQSKPIMEAYQKDPKSDFYMIVSDLTGLPRNAPHSGGANAKQLGLSLIFSMGEGTAAKEMGLPCTVERGKKGTKFEHKSWLKPGPEAIKILKDFHIAVPGIKEFSKKASSVAKSRGHLISLMGRHFHFAGGKGTHKCVAFLCQSATAEVNKVKMVSTHRLTKGTCSRLLLSVHDEINFSSDDPKLMKEVETEMQDFHSEKARLKLRVPMISEMSNGNNWYEAK